MPKIEKKSYCFDGGFSLAMAWVAKGQLWTDSPMVLNVHKHETAAYV